MEEVLKQILAKLDKMDDRLEKADDRLDHLETEQRAFRQEMNERLDDVENVVRMSAQDILDNQVDEMARHNLQEDKIHTLEASTFRIDKSVLELKRRVEKLEKTK